MPGSYGILSLGKYIAPLVAAASLSFTPPKIAPESYKSMQSIPITMSSYGYGEGRPHFAKGLVFERTANKVYWTHDGDSKRNGRAPDPDSYFHYGNWIKAGTENPPINNNYVSLPPRTSRSEAVESFDSVNLSSHINDTPLNKPIHLFYLRGLRINEAGKEVSKTGNFRQRINNYLRTSDGMELPASLIASGGKPTEIDNIVVGGLPSRALYGVAKRKGRISLKAAEDVYQKVAAEARYFGIGIYDLMDTMLAEELAHLWLGDLDKAGDSIKIEEAAKEAVLRHYLRLAKGAEGDPKKRTLKERRYKQALVKKIDLETVDRYSKKGSFYKQLYNEDRGALEEVLTDEAIEEGYRGKDVKAYVSNRMKEMGGETDAKESRMSKLERIAEEGKDSAQPEASPN